MNHRLEQPLTNQKPNISAGGYHAVGVHARAALVLAAFIGCVSMAASRADAATIITVCSSGCDQTSIQDAINAASSGDTISVQDTTHTETGITVDKDLTIQGQGAANTTIDGGGSNSTIFTVNSGTTVTFSALTIQGAAPNGYLQAGGIYNQGTATIDNAVIQNNSSYYGAAGIRNDGTLSVTNSTFSGNTCLQMVNSQLQCSGAANGSAIYNFAGTLHVIDSIFSGNYSYAYGGAITSTSGTVTVAGTMFSGNSADEGGAIYNNGAAELTVTDSTFSDNNAHSGAGIYNLVQTKVTVTNSTFSHNTAGYGGAIYNIGSDVAGSPVVILINSTLSGNSATNYGGGIYNYDLSTVYATNSTFSGNSSAHGGGIYNGGYISTYQSASYLKSTILASQPSGSGEAGGNCYNDPGSTTFDEGYNISDDTSCGFVATGPANNGDGVDPLLDTAGLTDNGGPTQTVALQSGSLAISAIPLADCTDQGSPAVAIATDQRGVTRPQGVACDIGAFELTDQIFANGFEAGP